MPVGVNESPTKNTVSPLSFLLGHESAVIDRLAGEVGIREFEFVPALFCSVLHYLHSVNGIRRQTGHTIRLGVLQNVSHFTAEVDGAMELFGGGLREVGMIVVVVRDIDASELLDHA